MKMLHVIVCIFLCEAPALAPAQCWQPVETVWQYPAISSGAAAPVSSSCYQASGSPAVVTSHLPVIISEPSADCSRTCYCLRPTGDVSWYSRGPWFPEEPSAGRISGQRQQLPLVVRIELTNNTGKRMFFRIEFLDTDETKKTSEFFWLPPGEKDARSIFGNRIQRKAGRWMLSVTGHDPTNGTPIIWGGADGIPPDMVQDVDDPTVGATYKLAVKL